MSAQVFRRPGAWAAVALVLVAGCRPLESQGDDETGTSEGTAGETSEPFESPDECMSSEDCEGGHCVAPWTGEPPRGPAECVDACVGPLDLARFCIDDAACCEGLECSNDGLCEEPWAPPGDGDGDPGSGDGDGDPGDGDGDPGSGDGDGDPGSGDGDGDGP